MIKLAFLVVVISSPFIARAGFFDAVSSWFSADANIASAEGGVSDTKVALLEAAVNTNPTSTTTVDNLSTVDGKALLSEVGVTGTIADVTDTPASDQISVYVVHKGDTLASIAKMYDVSPNTIKWANDIKGTVKEGDVLTILPVSGIKYVVKKGDTLVSIAKKYKADATDIQQFNDLNPQDGLTLGDTIIIPDAEPATVIAPTVKKTSTKTKVISGSSGPSLSGYFIKPLPGSIRTQGVHGHNGVDLSGVPLGTSVLASAAGTVILAKDGGWNGAYGSYVVVSHPNGTQTLYAHLNTVSVTRGQTVSQGQKLGGMGNTGRSTGPHLHFEIRGAKNPF
jgi:LysM repeat protein